MDKLKKIFDEAAQAAAFFGRAKDEMVFGEGDTDAQIMLIGEAPGAEEVKLSRPFVGKAGKNLDEFLSFLGLERSEIYIANVIKFRPYKVSAKGRLSNRPPTPKETEHMSPFLLKEVEAVAPKVVVTLGNVALKCIIQDKKAVIGSYHAAQIPACALSHSFTLFPLYHPASIIYNQSLKEQYNKDLMLLKEYLGSLSKQV
jgi:uracil-DNA glycosylase